VARLLFEKAQEGVGNAHRPDYKLRY
jgi:hypothetical protein